MYINIFLFCFYIITIITVNCSIIVEINKPNHHNASRVLDRLDILYPLGQHRYLVNAQNVDFKSDYYRVKKRHLMNIGPQPSKSRDVLLHTNKIKTILKDMKFNTKHVSWEKYLPRNYETNNRFIEKDRIAIFNVTETQIKQLYQHKDTIWIDTIEEYKINNLKAFEIVLLGEPYIKHDLLFSSQHHDLSDIIVTIGDTGLDVNHCFFHSKFLSNHYSFNSENGDAIVKHLKANTFKHEKLYGYLQMTVPYGRSTLHTDFNDIKNGHGTHVSGTALGGLISECKKNSEASKQSYSNIAVFFFDFLNKDSYSQARGGLIIPPVLTPLMEVSYASGSRAFSNSWGSSTSRYTSYAMEMDDFICKHDDYNIIIANGNAGSGNLPGSVGSPATGKNVISVGASMNSYESFQSLNPLFFENRISSVNMDHVKSNPTQYNHNNLAGFSSRGPTFDGRIKPDVVAPGEFILSSRAHGLDDSDMLYMRGTSMATPLVARCVAVILNRFYKTYNNKNPSSALVKNILITSATTLTGSIQDFYIDRKTNKARAHQSEHKITVMDQGFGRVNLYPFLHNDLAFKDRIEINQFDKPTVFSYVTTKIEPELSFGMVYSDPASYPGSKHVLINQIKFKVLVWNSVSKVYSGENPDEIVYGNHLLGPDELNNVQRVRLDHIAKNAYIRVVIAANGPLYPKGMQKISFVTKNSLKPVDNIHECTLFDFKYYKTHNTVKRCKPLTLTFEQNAKEETKQCYHHISLTTLCNFETGEYIQVKKEPKPHRIRYLYEIDHREKQKKQKVHIGTIILVCIGIITPLLTFARLIVKNEHLLSNIDLKRKRYHNA